MVKNVVSLEQGGESKANFVNHGPHDVSGPASMSSLRETAASWRSWPYCCRTWRGWGKCPKASKAATPPPPGLTESYCDTHLPFPAALWDPPSFTWPIFTIICCGFQRASGTLRAGPFSFPFLKTKRNHSGYHFEMYRNIKSLCCAPRLTVL